MSNVTNLILSFDIRENEEARIAEVNAYSFRRGVGFRDLTECGGGTKYFEIPVWGGAFNYLDLDDLLAHLRTVDWESPGLVRLFVCEQWDDSFRLVTFGTPPA